MYHLYNLLLFSRFFEDQELHKDKDSKYRFKKDGKKHTLIIMEATLDDIGMYHAWTNGGHTKGELEVEGTTPTFHTICYLMGRLHQTQPYVISASCDARTRNIRTIRRCF